MTRIINLAERRDRRREIEREIASFGMRPGQSGVHFFDAIHPNEAAGFPSRGVRGCFLSHLEVLREAVALDVDSVLILEDDLSISPLLPKAFPEIAIYLENEPWGIAYFGYTDSDKIHIQTDRKIVPYDEPVGCTHFYAVHKRILRQLITFLEALQERTLGDPAGGPMHYDGALTTFRAQHPQILTLLAFPCLGFQRSSRSDIYIRWFERIPIMRQGSELARSIRARLRTNNHSAA